MFTPQTIKNAFRLRGEHYIHSLFRPSEINPENH